MELYCLPYFDLRLSAFTMIAKEKKKGSYSLNVILQCPREVQMQFLRMEASKAF